MNDLDWIGIYYLSILGTILVVALGSLTGFLVLNRRLAGPGRSVRALILSFVMQSALGIALAVGLADGHRQDSIGLSVAFLAAVTLAHLIASLVMLLRPRGRRADTPSSSV